MSWAEVGNNNGNGENTKVEFVKFPVGVTKLRIVDAEPESRWTHWIPQANGGKGLSVRCIGKDCPICAAIKADKQANRKSKYNSVKNHAINVINRTADNQIQLLDKGNQIFNQLKVVMSQMGDLRNYDVNVTRTGEGFGNTSYTVLPVYPPTPLTPEEQQYVDDNRYDIKEITKGFTKEQMIKLMSGATIEEINKENKEEEPQAEMSNEEVSENEMPDFTIA